MSEVVDPWQDVARKKALPEEFIERLDQSQAVSEEEKAKIVESVKVASDVPQPGGTIEMIELAPGDRAVPGIHFVLWGPGSLSMTERYPVLRTALETESQYVERNAEETKSLVAGGLKNPIVKGRDRVARAREYATWRYRGFLAGEIFGL